MKAIVFDLDGTLVDSAPDLRAAANATLGDEGIDAIDLTTVESFVGDGIDVLVERCFAHRHAESADRAAALARFRGHYAVQGHQRTRVLEGVPEALAALKAAGIGLAVCTNKDEAFARDLLAGKGLLTHFAAVVGGDTAGRRKPDPTPLLACARLCGAAASDTAYVGDSEVDEETAAAAGITFVLYEGGYRRDPARSTRAVAAFRSFADLPALIADLDEAISREAV